MPTTRTTALTTREFGLVRDLLARYCGVYIDDGRRRVIDTALAERVVATGLAPDGYLRWIGDAGGRVELQRLAELALNHETTFFRNGPQFEALRDEVLPALNRRKPPGEPLRLWSAGCATGEEAYSLAVCVLEALGSPPLRPTSIWGTDLSAPAIARATEGCYSGRALAQVGPALLERYFDPDGASYRVRDQARRLVRFEQLNLLQPLPPAALGVDIIFCQNVTIYFQLETCRLLMDRFYQVLPEGGMLFLGFSETLWHVYDRFQLEQIGGAFVYVKRTASPSRKATGTLTAPRAAPLPPLASRPARAPVATLLEAELVDQGRALLEQGTPDAALATLRQISPASRHYPHALALVAQIHADRGDLDQAVAEARRSIAVDPLTEEAHVLLGLLYLRQGQGELAVAQLERARYLNAGSPLIRFHLAEAYRQFGRTTDARREYANALRALEPLDGAVLVGGVSADWLRETCRRYL